MVNHTLSCFECHVYFFFRHFFFLRLVNRPCPAIHLTPLMSDVLGKKLDCVSDQLFHLAQDPICVIEDTVCYLECLDSSSLH